jgi:polyferredoxin
VTLDLQEIKGMQETKKKLVPVAPGSGKIWDIRHWRYLSQLGFFIFIGLIFYLKLTNGEGNVADTEAYCPLGGFESLYYFLFVSNGTRFIQSTHLSNLVLFIALLLTTIAAGGFFCGWICPLGTIQQAITGFRRWLQKRVSFLATFGKWLKNITQPLSFLDRWLKYARYLVLIWIIWGTITAGVMVFRDVDPWSGIINIAENGITVGFWVFIGTLVAALIGDRVWCRYLCPLGAIVGLVGKIGLIRVQREPGKCINCKLCTRQCPMDIQVHAKGRVMSSVCNSCLNCVDVCPSPGALETRICLPIPRKNTATQVEGAAHEQ